MLERQNEFWTFVTNRTAGGVDAGWNLDFRIRFCLVEDTRLACRWSISAALERRHRVQRESGLPRPRGAGMRAGIPRGENRIVLLDLMLPDGDGLDILR